MGRPILPHTVALLALAARGLEVPAVRDNYLDIQGAASIGWTETLHSISSGQPYDGIETFGTSIRIRAGRQGSPGPAADFFEGLSFEAHVMGLGAYKAKKPSDLNFATFGTFTATFPSGATRTCAGVRIGQGHEGAHNNWWVASKDCILAAGHELACEHCGLAFYPGGDDHTLKLREIEVSTTDDNRLDFQGAESIAWKETSHSITSGQHYEGVSTQGSTLDVKAGRSGSAGPAAAFFEGLQDSDVHAMSLSEPSLATRPADLNFATFGALTAHFPYGVVRTCEDMRIGQTHEGASNTWWIASKDCMRATGGFVCESCGVSIYPGDNDHQLKIHRLTGAAAGDDHPVQPPTAPPYTPTAPPTHTGGGKLHPVQPPAEPHTHTAPPTGGDTLPWANPTHYGNPETGCQSDERSVQVQGVSGAFCSPLCGSSDESCPSDLPIPGRNALELEPRCDLETTAGKHCVLTCEPGLSDCGEGGRCVEKHGDYAFCIYDAPRAVVAETAVLVPKAHNPTHYGHPNTGCRGDEQVTKVQGVSGAFCSPLCDAQMGCPLDMPTTSPYTHATCGLIKSERGSLCALTCTPGLSDCGAGRCEQTPHGCLCTYDEPEEAVQDTAVFARPAPAAHPSTPAAHPTGHAEPGTGPTHYGNPLTGCQGDEQAVQVQGVRGAFCSPLCGVSEVCPSDFPVPSAEVLELSPSCDLETTAGKRCVLTCEPGLSDCGQGGRCVSKTLDYHICTYDAPVSGVVETAYLHPQGPHNPAHYGHPNTGCRGDEQVIKVQGVSGAFCSPLCDARTGCPLDTPNRGAQPYPPHVSCGLIKSERGSLCALTCTPGLSDCGAGRCEQTPHGGLCTYDEPEEAVQDTAVFARPAPAAQFPLPYIDEPQAAVQRTTIVV